MKKVVIVLIALVAFNVQAQRGDQHKKSDLTPEQRATIRSKEMTLTLELSESQEKSVLALNMKNAKEFSKSKGDKKELTDEERYDMKIKMLDMKIATQRELKNILNEDQYAKMQKMQKSRKKKSHGDRKGNNRGKREHPNNKGGE